MIYDYRIQKPDTLSGYSVHRFVAELCDGERYLFVDRGDCVVIRTEKVLSEHKTEVKSPSLGEVLAFTLRASVSKRIGGKDRYARLGNWRARHEWLQGRSQKNGFDLLALHVTDQKLQIEGKDGKRFYVDQSDFTGVLKVRDAGIFETCLRRGIGRVGKPYGMGMLVI